MPSRTIDRLETGEADRPRTRTMKAVVEALVAAGVEFIPANGGGPGVRLTHEAGIRAAVAAAKSQ